MNATTQIYISQAIHSYVLNVNYGETVTQMR